VAASGVHDLLRSSDRRFYLRLPRGAARQIGYKAIRACRIDEEVVAGNQVGEIPKVWIDANYLHRQTSQRLRIFAARNRSDFPAACQRVPYDCLADVAGGAQDQYSSKPLCHRGVSRIRVYNEAPVKAPYSFGFVGDAITRCIALALPSSKVRAMLPAGLGLCAQSVTPQGTHPVILQSHTFAHCQFSFPTMLPPMSFHEQTLGIPFVCVSAAPGLRAAGPYYFMPKLYLDDRWNLFIGRNFWGFNKELARVRVNAGSYTVTSMTGRRLAGLTWSVSGDEPRPAIGGYEQFEPVRKMLSQTPLSFSPAAVGPIPTLTDFDRSWNLGTVRRLRAVLDIDAAYCPRFSGGHYETADETGQASGWPALAFEVSAQWWLSYPYLLPGAMTGPGMLPAVISTTGYRARPCSSPRAFDAPHWMGGSRSDRR
jgi:hypothetical protein